MTTLPFLGAVDCMGNGCGSWKKGKRYVVIYPNEINEFTVSGLNRKGTPDFAECPRKL
jgi:hypothetical protein